MIDEWEELQRVVLGYIYGQGGLEGFRIALARVKNQYFSGEYRFLWGVLIRYNAHTLGIPSDKQQFRKFCRSSIKFKEKKLFDLEELLRLCNEAASQVDEAGFVWHLGRLRDVYRHIMLDEALVAGREELEARGYTDAKANLLVSLSSIETAGIDLSQEGDIVRESDEVMKEVNEAKRVRAETTVTLGFPGLDRHILGLSRGDLVLVAGWTGVGKTCFAVNVSADVVFIQKKNVVYVTTETTRTPLRRRFYSRLTLLPVFEGHVPLPVYKLKSGELSEDEKETLFFMDNYLKTEPHGVLQIVQAPARATVHWLRGKLLQFESQFKVDLVVVDDLRSMTPAVHRRQEFEDISQIVKDLKNVARTHANRGVPIISPHHISRDAYKGVLSTEEGERRMFNLSALASSSEAERRSDLVLGMWYDSEGEQGRLRIDILKMRDGRAGDQINVDVNWDCQYMHERETGVDDIGD